MESEAMEIKFFRNTKYNNAFAVRQIPGYRWMWAGTEEDFRKVLKSYPEVKFEIVQPEGELFVVSWKELDRYICGKSDQFPKFLPFDREKHLVRWTTRTQYCWCGCGREEGEYPWLDTPFAVAELLSPQ